jgi:hypothetical protein
LQKDPRQRVQAIGDVRLALEGAFETAVPQTAAPAVVSDWRRIALAGVATIIASGAIVGTLVWFAARRAESVSPRVSRLQIAPAGAAALTINWNDRGLAITPDGSRLIYVGNNGTQIFVRALDAVAPVPVFTGYPTGLFVSPDGQWIGFVDGLSSVLKAGVHERRHAANLGAERAGAGLCLLYRGDHGGGRGARPVVGGHDADATGEGGVLHDSDLVGPIVRYFTRRPAVPDDQGGRRRRHSRACEHHRRAALGRGTEAARAWRN